MKRESRGEDGRVDMNGNASLASETKMGDAPLPHRHSGEEIRPDTPDGF